MRRFRILKEYALKVGCLTLISYLFQRYILFKKLIAIRVAGLEHKIFLRNEPDDLALFTQIFIREEYNADILFPVNNILDCGANIGLASLYFKRKYRNSVIICIEPEVSNFQILELNTKEYKNIFRLNSAIWNNNSLLNVVNYNRGSAGLMVKQFNPVELGAINGVTIKDLVSKFNLDQIDILKMDIEGSEKQVLLESNFNWKDKVKNIFVELHEDLNPGITVQVINEFRNSFRITKNGEYHILENILL